jgi:hypothetical protein
MLGPEEDFRLEPHNIEYRRELLTGRTCKINIKRSQCKRQVQKGRNYANMIELSVKNCYFCPDKIKASTPIFPPSLVLEGRIEIGETTVFPNFFRLQSTMQ